MNLTHSPIPDKQSDLPEELSKAEIARTNGTIFLTMKKLEELMKSAPHKQKPKTRAVLESLESKIIPFEKH